MLVSIHHKALVAVAAGWKERAVPQPLQPYSRVEMALQKKSWVVFIMSP